MTTRAEKRYAILIASSSYPKEPGLTDLRCPENDVDALAEVLRSPDLGGFTKTVVFKNRPSHEVLERIETVLGEVGREDLVLIYFSGHGKLNPAGQLCLATANTKLRALGSTSIPVGSIKSYFDHSASRKKILLLDCCYSGAVGKDFAKGGVGEQLQLMSRGQGTFIMTASTGIEVAVEKEGDTYGLFTKHIVQGIRSGEADKDEDGFVDMQELYEYVHDKVGGEGAQKPMQWGLGVKGRLVIARSGRVAKEKRRQELRAKLYELAAQGWLSDGIVSAAVNVISLLDKEMTAKERECLLLIEQLADERISAGEFVESWVKSCLTPEPPPPPKLKLLLLILVAVSCAAAGAGWYFFREPPPVSAELPKMGTVSVSLQTLPSLSQIKLQPLSPLSSPSEQTDLPDKTDVTQKQEQSATIPVSPPVEPEKPLVIVDHPKKKQGVVNARQTHTENVLEKPVVSQPKQGDPFTDPATGMELVYVPKGCFQMGQMAEEKKQLIAEVGQKDYDSYYKDELPRHKVCVDGFWMGKYEVTQGQWQKIMGDNPAGFKKGDKYPVEQVSWEDTQKFITKLNKRSGKEYRLSTEAEWEYAARAKSSYKYSGGDDLDAVAWYDGNSGDSTHPVGQKKANAFGLYDMSGNVLEWCADWYDGKYYASSPQGNPTGPNSGTLRVLRGGGWFDLPVGCRSVHRYRGDPEDRGDIIGFRLVLPFQAAGS